jgi:PPE-repeat protein
MNKFKKVLTMILVGVVLLGGVVFGAPVENDSAELAITTTIENMVSVKLIDKNYGATLDTKESYTNAAEVSTLVEVDNTYFTPTLIRQVAWFSNTEFKLTMEATPLTTTGTDEQNSHKIHYKVTVDVNSYDTSNTSAEPVLISNVLTDGIGVGNKKILIEIDSTTYNGAPADSYSGTITFNIEST